MQFMRDLSPFYKCAYCIGGDNEYFLVENVQTIQIRDCFCLGTIIKRHDRPIQALRKRAKFSTNAICVFCFSPYLYVIVAAASYFINCQPPFDVCIYGSEYIYIYICVPYSISIPITHGVSVDATEPKVRGLYQICV